MAGGKILVVDDDEVVANMLLDVLQARGHDVRIARNVKDAKAALDASDYDAMMLDMFLPDGAGLDVLRHALDREPSPQVLVITARAEIEGAVEAMRMGAADYISKPFDAADLTTRLARAMESATARRKLALYEATDRSATSAVVASSALQEVFNVASRVAATPASSALILGESGVGKEVLAARIHQESDRSAAPMVRVNLAAIPESMIEAELFGSVKGAFTDSKRDRAGHFASAEGGTLLLDELCEFKPELQPKLLRVLEERRYFPVGSDRERRMNVRVLAATNRDPQEAIASGRLRADLYYRLATVVLRIPPLRERQEDIVPLAEHFLAKFRGEFGRPGLRFTRDVPSLLTAYGWPGNVRELRNAVERATMLATSSTVGPESFDLPITATTVTASMPATRLEDAERLHITRTLAEVGGSRSRAASALGISRSTLWEKLKRYGMG